MKYYVGLLPDKGSLERITKFAAALAAEYPKQRGTLCRPVATHACVMAGPFRGEQAALVAAFHTAADEVRMFSLDWGKLAFRGTLFRQLIAKGSRADLNLVGRLFDHMMQSFVVPVAVECDKPPPIPPHVPLAVTTVGILEDLQQCGDDGLSKFLLLVQGGIGFKNVTFDRLALCTCDDRGEVALIDTHTTLPRAA
jgi:hypothetical protein